MFLKSLRVILIFLTTTILLPWNSTLTHRTAQAAAPMINQKFNSLETIIGIIFEQPIHQSGILYQSSWLDPDGSDYDEYIWDNFTFPTNETITEINWVGGYDPLRFGNGGPVINFSVSIYPSNTAGTEPDVANPPLVEYLTGDNAGETLFGVVGDITMYTYAFSLPIPFDASAGVKYWVQIEAFQHGIIPDWGMSAGTGGNSNHFKRMVGAGGDIIYLSVPGDAAFSLLGPIVDTPTDIALSNNSVDENQPVNSVVGELTAADPDPYAVFTFSLTCSAGGPDDGAFNILDTNLRTSHSFDFETKSIYNICIRVTDQNNLTFDKNFAIYVNDVPESLLFFYLPTISR